MWHEELEGNKFINNLYKEVPALTNVRIVAINITDEGRRVSINFNMPKFTDTPPLKWTVAGYNAVFVELDFFDVTKCGLSYGGNSFKGDIKIEKNEEDQFIVVVSGSVNMNFLAEVGMIQSVSGYIDESETI